VFDWKSKARVTTYDVNESGSVTTTRDTRNGTDPYFGGGLSWVADKHWTVRAEWRRFQVDDTDMDFVSAGGAFHF
jgi:hypothetical protein